MKKTFVLKGYDGIESSLEERGYGISVKKFINYRVATVEFECEKLSDVSGCIFDAIKCDYEVRQIRNYIKRKKNDLFKLQIGEIAKRVREQLSVERSGDGQSIDLKAKNELMDYIEKCELVDLDGFLKFRLKYYRAAILASVEKTILELECEEEYKSFIEAFRYFVKIQKPKQEEINIVFEEKGYRIMDKDRNPIGEEHIKSIGEEIYDEGLNMEEILMSTLITTSPEKIHIYKDGETSEDIVNTIEEIFVGKVKKYDKFKALPI